MTRLNRLPMIALAGFAAAACSDTAPTAPAEELAVAPDLAKVSVSSVTGLQDALDAASANPRLRRVELDADITLEAPLYYDSHLPLRIEGNGYTITGPDVAIDEPVLPGDRYGEPSGGDAFVLMGGGNVRMNDLTIADASGNGIYMEIPADRRGLVRVIFEEVHLTNNGLSGLWIEEQANEAGPIAGRASIFLGFDESSVTGNGFAGEAGQEAYADWDGVRVNEGGKGSIRLRTTDSHFDGNAAEGIELDEKGDGSVRADLEESTFNGNGEQPQFSDDLEDGFDIDEADAGGIVVVMEDVEASNNFDEGIDLDEEGYGDVVLRFENVTANDNNDENIKVSEDAELEDAEPPFDGGGDIRFRFEEVTANGSNDDGVQLEEFGPGDLRGTIEESEVTGNGDDGLDLTQAATGEGLVKIDEDTDVSGNVDDDVNPDGVTVVTEGDD